MLTQISTPPGRGATLNRVYLALPINFPAVGPPATPSPIATNTAVLGLTVLQLSFRILSPCKFPQSQRKELIIPARFGDSSTVAVTTENSLSGTEASTVRGTPAASRAFLAISGSLSNRPFERWMSVAATVPVSRIFFRENELRSPGFRRGFLLHTGLWGTHGEVEYQGWTWTQWWISLLSVD